MAHYGKNLRAVVSASTKTQEWYVKWLGTQQELARALERERQLREGDEKCLICGHEWYRHDPEDGCCDAPMTPWVGFEKKALAGPCLCGRDLYFMQRRIGQLSRSALETRADAL